MDKGHGNPRLPIKKKDTSTFESIKKMVNRCEFEHFFTWKNEDQTDCDSCPVSSSDCREFYDDMAGIKSEYLLKQAIIRFKKIRVLKKREDKNC